MCQGKVDWNLNAYACPDVCGRVACEEDVIPNSWISCMLGSMGSVMTIDHLLDNQLVAFIEMIGSLQFTVDYQRHKIACLEATMAGAEESEAENSVSDVN